jgi:hypothetical protein
MNTMLPTPRDLPPHSRARIRAELQRSYERRIGYPPIIAVAALVVAALAIVLVPGGSDEGRNIPPAATTPEPIPAPAFPGLTEQEKTAIESGCGQAIGMRPAELRNFQADEAGRFGLLYTNTMVVSCTLHRRGKTYDTKYTAIPAWHWLPGDLAVDQVTATSGGSSPSAGPERRGEPGEIRAEGRISGKVARVTFTEGDRTVDAALAYGTFLVRVLYPLTWEAPESYGGGIVRAYDADGKLLGEHPSPNPRCYRIPDNGYLGPPTQQPVDPYACPVATRWGG